MTQTHDEVTIRAYLDEVRREVAAVDPAQADGIVAEIAEHLRDAEADASGRGEPFDLDAALSELGDPALVAAAVEPPASRKVAPASVPTAPRRFLSTNAAVAITLVLIGFPMLGGGAAIWPWIAGLVLLWLSPRWSTTDKLIGTLGVPALIAATFALTSPLGVFYVWTLFVVSPPFVAIVLLLLVRRRGDRALRALRVPRAAAYPTPRSGLLAVADRWPGAIVAIAVVPAAVAVVLAPAFAAGDWAALPVTATIAAVMLVLGFTELLVSRGWSAADRAIGSAAVLAPVVALVAVISTAIASASPIRQCGSDGCVELAPALPETAALLDLLMRFVLPLVLVAAGWPAARFRSAVESPEALAHRRVAVIAAALAVLGAGVVPAILLAVDGDVVAAVLAAVTAGSWLVGVVLVLRSPGWGTIDHWLALAPLPLLAAGALLSVSARTDVFGRYYDYVPEDPAAPANVVIVPVVLGIGLAVQIVVAIRLVVAFRPSRRR